MYMNTIDHHVFQRIFCQKFVDLAFVDSEFGRSPRPAAKGKIRVYADACVYDFSGLFGSGLNPQQFSGAVGDESGFRHGPADIL